MWDLDPSPCIHSAGWGIPPHLLSLFQLIQCHFLDAEPEGAEGCREGFAFRGAEGVQGWVLTPCEPQRYEI